MILLAFSMPPATPKTMIRQEEAAASTIQKVEPPAEAARAKVPPIRSMS